MRALIPFCVCWACWSAATGDDSIAAIRSALSQREAKISTASISASAQHKMAAGMVSKETDGYKTVTMPQFDIALSSNKFRLQFNDIGLLLQDPKSTGTYVCTFDGDETRSLLPFSSHLRGVIYDESKFHDISHIDLMPALLAFRPSCTSLMDANASVVSEHKTVVNGAQCIVVQLKFPATERRDAYWVDPAKDYSVIKWTSAYEGGGLGKEVSVSYRTAKVGWLPSAWSSSLKGDGIVLTETMAVVNSGTINEPINDSQFTINYPVGTIVDDRKAGYLFVQQKDGKRQVTQSDMASVGKYSDLSGLQYSHQWWRLALGAALFGAIVFVVAYVYRTRVRD